MEEQRKLLKKSSKELQAKQNERYRNDASIALEKAFEGATIDAQNVSATLDIATLESAITSAEGTLKNYADLEKRDSAFKKIAQSRRKQLKAAKKAIATRKKTEVKKAKDEVSIALATFNESLEAASDEAAVDTAKGKLAGVSKTLSKFNTRGYFEGVQKVC